MFFLLLGGCATTEYRALPEPPVKTTVTKTEVRTEITTVKVQGFYHKVAKGQILFRIAKAYGVPVEDVIKANNIPNAAAIEVNQLIFIPGAKEAKEVVMPKTPAENKDEFAWPLKGKVISYFNDHHGDASNRGIDIQANDGDEIKACREGVVIMADYLAGYGQTIMIDHGDNFITVYAQNRKLLGKLGDHVSKGDMIAEIGSTGKRIFVHFEVRKKEIAVNPLFYLP